MQLTKEYSGLLGIALIAINRTALRVWLLLGGFQPSSHLSLSHVAL